MNPNPATDIHTGKEIPAGGANGNGGNIRERIARIEARLDSIERYGATREDIVSMENRILRWLVGTAIAASGILIMAGFMLSRAMPS